MELKIFDNSEFGNIRTLLDENGNILFCGADAAKALGYRKPQNAIRMHCRRCALKQGIPHPQNPDRAIEMLFIPEPDLYRLITHSKLPDAEKFEQWVFEEVLPTLRSHGAYMVPEVLAKLDGNPELTAELIQLLKRDKENTNELRQKMSQMTEKSDYFDKLVSTETLTNIRQTAKELHIPEKLFTYLLVEMGFAYRTKRLLMPYAFMVTSGFVELKEYVNGRHGGIYMLFTPVGRLYMMQKIKQRLTVNDKEVQNEENNG